MSQTWFALQVVLDNAREVWRRRKYRVRRATTPGTFHFTVLDNGGLRCWFLPHYKRPQISGKNVISSGFGELRRRRPCCTLHLHTSSVKLLCTQMCARVWACKCVHAKQMPLSRPKSLSQPLAILIALLLVCCLLVCRCREQGVLEDLGL